MVLHRVMAAGFLISVLAHGYATPQKMPGATNLAVTDGEPYNFQCNPPEAEIFINEKGEVYKPAGKKPKKLSAGLSDFAAGSYIEYLECFVIGDDVVAAFKQSNGSDFNITVRRKRLTGKGLIWNFNIQGLKLKPPSLGQNTLVVPIDDANFEIDVEKGELVATNAKGCIRISRFPKTKGGVHGFVGAGCTDKKGPAEPFPKAK